MILFYVIDAVAIYAVLKQHPHDSDAAVGLQHRLLAQQLFYSQGWHS